MDDQEMLRAIQAGMYAVFKKIATEKYGIDPRLLLNARKYAKKMNPATTHQWNCYTLSAIHLATQTETSQKLGQQPISINTLQKWWDEAARQYRVIIGLS